MAFLYNRKELRLFYCIYKLNHIVRRITKQMTEMCRKEI